MKSPRDVLRLFDRGVGPRKYGTGTGYAGADPRAERRFAAGHPESY
ncbi:MAG TPA: hypothetical protein VIW24_17630 [Aldersonia sp.]